MPGDRGEKAERRVARELVADYHESELARLLEHVRDGFARYDAGELDAFELDDLIHRYKRSARELGSSARSAAATRSGSRERSRMCEG